MIDLKNIAARELPRKTVKVNILGQVQEQEIHPLQGEARLKSWSLDFSENASKSTLERVIIALTQGADLPADIATRLISLDWDAAVSLAGEILNFTNEFEKTIAEEKKTAEKNLPPEAGTATQA